MKRLSCNRQNQCKDCGEISMHEHSHQRITCIDRIWSHFCIIIFFYHFLSLSHPVPGRVIIFSCRAMKKNITSLQIRRCYLIEAHRAEFIFLHIPHPYRFSSHFVINPPHILLHCAHSCRCRRSLLSKSNHVSATGPKPH